MIDRALGLGLLIASGAVIGAVAAPCLLAGFLAGFALTTPRWWTETVRRPGQPEKNCPRSETILSEEQAVLQTGIKNQQVPRWRNSLRDEDKYRQVLFGPRCPSRGRVPWRLRALMAWEN